jgi:hypothetical protein
MFNSMFTSVKTANDHLLNVATLQNGYVYLFNNDNIIKEGDTLSDTTVHHYTITLKGCTYIPSGWYASAIISGSTAIVSRYVAFNEINGDFLAKWAQLDQQMDNLMDPLALQLMQLMLLWAT